MNINKSLFLFVCLFASQVFAEESREVRDITVTSEIQSWTGVKAARVTFVLEQVSASASEAYSALVAKESRISAALGKFGITSGMLNRGEKVHSLSDVQQRILPGTQIKIVRNLGVEVKDISNLGQIVDAINNSGAQSVSDIEYSAASNSDSELNALGQATDRARVKADVIARSLGVKLGRIMSVTVTDEPAGSQIQQQIVRGGNSLDYQDRSQQIYVNVSFEISGGESQKALDERLNRLLEAK